jgi:hypothetical protein
MVRSEREFASRTMGDRDRHVVGDRKMLKELTLERIHVVQVSSPERNALRARARRISKWSQEVAQIV